MKKHRGNRSVNVRMAPPLLSKVARLAQQTGTDQSTIMRAAVSWLSEEQIAQLITTRQGQPAGVNHAS